MSVEKEKLITISTITTDYKMHFPREVAERLAVKPGSKVVWYETAKGDIVVRRA